MSVVLDTNVLIYLLRNKEPQVSSIRTHLSDDPLLIISIVTKAELLSIASQNNWHQAKRNQLEQLLDKFVIVPISAMDIIERYAAIDAYSQGKLKDNPLPKGVSARNMGKNDLWIAATAAVTNSNLLTGDSDFSHLSPSGLLPDLMRFNT